MVVGCSRLHGPRLPRLDGCGQQDHEPAGCARVQGTTGGGGDSGPIVGPEWARLPYRDDGGWSAMGRGSRCWWLSFRGCEWLRSRDHKEPGGD